jgi:hypothetical protein
MIRGKTTLTTQEKYVHSKNTYVAVPVFINSRWHLAFLFMHVMHQERTPSANNFRSSATIFQGKDCAVIILLKRRTKKRTRHR